MIAVGVAAIVVAMTGCIIVVVAVENLLASSPLFNHLLFALNVVAFKNLSSY